MKPINRRLVRFRSAREPIADPEPSWWAEHRAEIRCARCWGPPRAWIDAPRGLDVVIAKELPGSIVWLTDTDMHLLHKDFHRVLAPHARACYFGKVMVPGPRGLRVTPYVSWMPHPSGTVLLHRGADGFYSICPECGQFVRDWGAEEVVVDRTLDHHAVYFGDGYLPLLDADFMARRRLRERFPDLRTFRVRVVPEPLDGETLPGDPGWDGTFRPRFTSVPQRERILDAERAAAKAGAGRTSGTPSLQASSPPSPRPKTPKPHTSRRTKRKRA